MTSYDKPLSNHDHEPRKTRKGKRVNVKITADTKPIKDVVDAALAEVQFAGQLVKHVTRFLVHPDCRVCHGGDPADLRIDAVRVDDGQVICTTINCETGVEVDHPFAELWPAGPASDFTREAVKIMARAMVEDTVGQLIDAGALRKPDPADLPAVAVPSSSEHEVDGPTSETVHHLGVHPEYLINPDGSTSPGHIIDDA